MNIPFLTPNLSMIIPPISGKMMLGNEQTEQNILNYKSLRLVLLGSWKPD